MRPSSGRIERYSEPRVIFIHMVAIDAAKLATQTGFKRTNPKTDLFKVCQIKSHHLTLVAFT